MKFNYKSNQIEIKRSIDYKAITAAKKDEKINK